VELTKLVVNAQAGDEESEAALLLRLGPMFRGFFIKRIGVRPEVDDLVQNTLVRVHKSLVDLKHPDRLKGFAMKAALFELQDYYRGRVLRQRGPVRRPASARSCRPVGQYVCDGRCSARPRYTLAKGQERLSS